MNNISDTLFHFENRLKIVEDYRTEIDITRDFQIKLSENVNEKQLDMRASIEKNLEKIMK